MNKSTALRPIDLGAVIREFAVDGKSTQIVPYGTGHINDTYAATMENDGEPKRYVLQRINTRIFKDIPALLTCYLQDLFTVASERGRGIGRALIAGVDAEAKMAGIKRFYWQTHETNAAGRALYDKVATHAGFIVYAHEV